MGREYGNMLAYFQNRLKRRSAVSFQYYKFYSKIKTTFSFAYIWEQAAEIISCVSNLGMKIDFMH